MRVVFLDIDGPLNLQTSYTRNKETGEVKRTWSGLLPEKMDLLNQILEQSGAVVVISSSWRFSKTAEQIAKRFREVGFRGGIIGTTGILQREEGWHTRGYEILHWLLDHWDEVDGFCMIDDGRHHSRLPIIESRLVQTTSSEGLQPEHVQQAVALLGAVWKPGR